MRNLFVLFMIFLAPFARNIDDEGDIANFEKCLSMHYTEDIKDYHYVGSGCYSFQMTFVCSPSTFDTLKVKMDLVRKKNEYTPHVYKEHAWWKHEDIIGIKNEYRPRQKKIDTAVGHGQRCIIIKRIVKYILVDLIYN